jgi:aquaporin Z
VARRAGRRSQHHAQYRSLLTNHILPRWGETSLSDITGIGVVAWATKPRCDRLRTSPRSATITKVLSMLLADAAAAKLIAANPVRARCRGKGARMKAREQIWATPQEALQVADNAAALVGSWAGRGDISHNTDEAAGVARLHGDLMDGQPHDAASPAPAGERSTLSALSVLEAPWSSRFDDPSQEWRRLFSELFGTFLLVLVGAGGAVVNAVSDGQISRTAAVTAPGLTVLAIILFMGHIGGAHLNPAVSLAFALRGDFPWRRVPGYILAQLVGATLACLFLWAVFGKVGELGATVPGTGVSDVQAMIIEMVLTAGLVSTILGTASTAQNVGPLSAIAVAGYIVLAGLWSSPISGASMNPARSFGPDLAILDFSTYWVYLAGPIAGAVIAVGIAMVLRGRGGDAGGRAAARGTH